MNFIGHLKTVLKHKWQVFKLSIRAGIPLRGLMHDLSKFSYTEFSESVKYYQQGKRSPIPVAREENGYSKAWLHHKGRNKHHLEYWYDRELKVQPIIPFKYCEEMVCDKLAAGITYKGKEWTKEFELEYWNTKERDRVDTNEAIKNFLTEVFTEVSENGIDKTITKKNLKKIYDKYCDKANTN